MISKRVRIKKLNHPVSVEYMNGMKGHILDIKDLPCRMGQVCNTLGEMGSEDPFCGIRLDTGEYVAYIKTKHLQVY